MERLYKQFQASLGEKFNGLSITDDHIDFKKTHTECRDKGCLITFGVFVVIGFAILLYSLIAGRPGLLYKPVDDSGGVCGYDFNNINNKGKSYFDMFGNECVESCPSGTKPTMSYCVPEELTDALQNMKSDLLGDIVSRIWVASISLVITAGLCLLYIVLLIFLAYYIVWGTIFVSIAGIGILTLVFFILAIVMFARGDDISKPVGIIFIVFAIVFLIVFTVVCCVVYFLRSRISLCIALVQEACRGIKALPWLMFIPAASTILTGVVYVFFCLTLIFFIGSFKVTVMPLGAGFAVRIVDFNAFHIIVIIVAIFIALWLSFLCIGLAQSIIAGSLAAWYFDRDRSNLAQSSPVFGAFFRTFRYSIGTICAGSGIIALIETLKIICSYDKDKKNSGGGCLACLCCCLTLLFMALERFIIFISARAYILASITGNGFIQTCKDSFFLLLRSILITIVLENVKTLPTTLGKIFIFVITAFLSLIIVNPYVFSGSSNTGGYVVTYWFIVYIICLIIILFVLQTMTTIVTYSVDSIFIFYLVDEEYSQCTGSTPYASPELAKHMDLVADKGREIAQKDSLSVPTDPKLMQMQNPGQYPQQGQYPAQGPYPYPAQPGPYPAQAYPYPPPQGQYPAQGYPYPPPQGGDPAQGYPYPPPQGQYPAQGYPYPPPQGYPYMPPPGGEAPAVDSSSFNATASSSAAQSSARSTVAEPTVIKDRGLVVAGSTTATSAVDRNSPAEAATAAVTSRSAAGNVAPETKAKAKAPAVTTSAPQAKQAAAQPKAKAKAKVAAAAAAKPKAKAVQTSAGPRAKAQAKQKQLAAKPKPTPKQAARDTAAATASAAASGDENKV